MSDIEKRDSHSDAGDHQSYQRPTRLKGLYYHPITQVAMLGGVAFMCPGLFNALTGLGGGGQVDATTGANANAALYATFAVGAMFAGSVNNKLGPRLTLLLGSTGYALYIGAFLALNIHPHAGAFVIASGAILGICAGLLWTAQGSLMLAYPTEGDKGKFIGIFWSIFNLGGVVGAAVSLGQNIHSEARSVGNGTYIGFLILTLIGVTIPMLMADPEKMIQIIGLWVTLRSDPAIVLLFPMFFASNWFTTWQVNDFNGQLFNIRGRSLNNFVYWLAQIFGSVSIGLLLDRNSVSRRVRAFTGWFVLLVMVFIVHVWGYEYQKNYTRASVAEPSFVPLDISDKGYVGRIWLYIFCGLLDAMWQTTAYWMMGAMSNDLPKLAYLTGFYKSIQSAGAAGVWRADAVKLPFMNIFASTWGLLVAGLMFALPMIHYRVKNYTDMEDETIARMDESGHVHPVEKVVGHQAH